jgi:peptidoglycan/LPS O-acetylase OafA/YrhL
MSDAVPGPDRPRFDFLHGLRGLAALAIVLFHATLNAQGSSNPVLRALQQPLLHGYLAVSVFLVLSGFLLAVPVVTNGFALRGGIGGFLRRRAIRILPPYYAAYVLDLLFFAGAIWLAGVTGLDPGGTVWHQREVGFGWSSVAAHLLLVHNASDAWVVGMDAILWSIACEWQIYLLFAILLVPVWRRAGSWSMLAVAAVMAAVIIEGCVRGWWMYVLPWMIPIFGIGALAAVVVVGEHPAAVAMRRWRWGVITAVTAAVAVAGVLLLDRLQTAEVPGGTPVRYYLWSFRVRWIYDVLAALATASFVTWLALDIRRGGGTSRAAARTRSLLESRPLFTLGLFSYSLYLTHGLVLVAVVRATKFLGHAPTLRACVVMVAAVAISLALAYVFYRVVERRCMSAETRAMFTPAEADRPRIPAHPARRAAAASARPHDADRGSRP